MAGFDIGPYVDSAFAVVIGAIGIAITFGIGYYIVQQLNQASNGQLPEAVSLIQQQNTVLGTIVNFLFIGVVAAIGIGLVLYLRGAFGKGGPTK